MNLDEQMEKNIINCLYWDPRVDASGIDVEVVNRKAKIKGAVANHSTCETVEKIVSATPGVLWVANKLAVRQPSDSWLSSDDEIEQKVERFLWADPNIDLSNIDVSVREGLVSLEGSVDVYWKKVLAEEIADIRGVSGTINKLSVVPPGSSFDQVIAEDIMSAIGRIVGKHVESVNVKVDHGKVTLAGSVPSWQEHRAVRKAAVCTAGVIELNSDKLNASEPCSTQYQMSER